MISRLFQFFPVVVVFAAITAVAPPAQAAEPIHIALSAPLTGNFAEYGQNFQRAIDLAVEWINAAGGIKGRNVVIVAGDSKADPKEAAALAQKFTSDSRIVAEIGDFSSTACLAAQPIYDRAGMVYTSTAFFPKDPRPEVQKFVKGYEAKYKAMPNLFAAVAYDAMNLLAATIEKSGTERKAIRDELAKAHDFPGVTGKITFTERRDVVKEYRPLVVQDGEFTLFTK